MSDDEERGARGAAGRRRAVTEVVIDRTACTGHGSCAILSDGAITLDEWGYPVPSRVELPAGVAREVVRGCPARAILLQNKR